MKVLQVYKAKVKKNSHKNLLSLSPKPFTNVATADTAWLSGLTDREGCFSVRFFQNSPKFTIQFSVGQKGLENVEV